MNTFQFPIQSSAVGGELSLTFSPTFNPRTPIRIKSVYVKGSLTTVAGGISTIIQNVKLVLVTTNSGNIFQNLDNLAGTAPTFGLSPAWFFGPSNSKANCNLLVMGGGVITLQLIAFFSAALAFGDTVEMQLWMEWERVEGLNL